MLDVVHKWNNEVQVFYESQIVNQKRIYSQRWVKAVSFEENLGGYDLVPYKLNFVGSYFFSVQNLMRD